MKDLKDLLDGGRERERNRERERKGMKGQVRNRKGINVANMNSTFEEHFSKCFSYIYLFNL
jgi:hypothetical protein